MTGVGSADRRMLDEVLQFISNENKGFSAVPTLIRACLLQLPLRFAGNCQDAIQVASGLQPTVRAIPAHEGNLSLICAPAVCMEMICGWTWEGSPVSFPSFPRLPVASHIGQSASFTSPVGIAFTLAPQGGSCWREQSTALCPDPPSPRRNQYSRGCASFPSINPNEMNMV